MAFIESRFLESIAFGARGGPVFSTTVIVLNSGAEQRNQNWSYPLQRYDISHAVKTVAERDTLIATFYAAAGRANGFRFKDYADYQATVANGALVLISGSNYQLVKNYAFGAVTQQRKITKPVSGTLTISGGGSYTVDYTTGIVTKTSGAAPTAWAGEFDVPVRFDSDQMQIEILTPNAFTWGQITLSELR